MNSKIFIACCFIIIIGHSCNYDSKRYEAVKITFEISQSKVIKRLSQGEEIDSVLSFVNSLPNINNDNFLNIFISTFNKVYPDGRLVIFFSSVESRGKLSYSSSNQEVIYYIRDELNKLDKLITKQIQKRLKKSKIKYTDFKSDGNFRYSFVCTKKEDKDRAIKLICNPGKFEIFENFYFNEIYRGLLAANKKVYKTINSNILDNSFIEEHFIDSIYDNLNFNIFDSPYLPIFQICKPRYIEDPLIGISRTEDTSKVNNYLSISRSELPPNSKCFWHFNPINNTQNKEKLYIVKLNRRYEIAVINNSDIFKIIKLPGKSILVIFDAKLFRRFSGENIGRFFSIVIDNKMYIVSQIKKENNNGIIKLCLKDYSKEEVIDIKNMIKYNFPAELMHIVELK